MWLRTTRSGVRILQGALSAWVRRSYSICPRFLAEHPEDVRKFAQSLNLEGEWVLRYAEVQGDVTIDGKRHSRFQVLLEGETLEVQALVGLK